MQEERYGIISERIKALLSNQVFFIVGAPKSGTTWLQKILDSHPEILCSGEGHFRRFIMDCRELIHRYNKGQETVATYVYQGQPYYPPLGEEEFDYLVTAFISLRLTQRRTEKTVRFFGDKTPLHVQYMDTLHTLFPQAKFIHMVRDGRDTAISITRHSDRMLNRTPTMAGQELFYQCIKEAAERWHSAIQAGLRFKQQFPAQYHEVHYAELQQYPDCVLENVLDFLGAPHTPEIIRTLHESNTFAKLSGGRQVGEEDAGSFYRKGIVGDWKNHFDAKSIEIFNHHAGASLEALGYDITTAYCKS